MTSLLTSILDELGVKYTRPYVSQLYRETPDRDSFFGLSFMLSMYGIKSRGYSMDEQDISDISPPFVAQTKTGFVLITKADKRSVHIRDGKVLRSLLTESFLDLWSGNILTLSTTPIAGEPEYAEHKKEQSFETIKHLLFTSSCAVMLVFGTVRLCSSAISALLLSYLFNILGVGISFLLLKKQLHSDTWVGNRLCNLFGNNGCETVASSPAAKALLGLSWCEIGLGYFVCNLIILSIFPTCYTTLGILNILALPFTIWSLWYQNYRIKSWCPLCVLVQAIIWGLSLVFCFSDPPEKTFLLKHLFVLPFYCTVILFIHRHTSEKEKAIQQKDWVLKYRSQLCRKDVLSILLQGQPFFNVSDKDSCILTGCVSAQMHLTIVTNPFCGPCARVHMIMERLLNSGADVQVRYLFVSHKDILLSASSYLIGSYFKYGDAALNDWFRLGLADKRRLLESACNFKNDADIEAELSHHKSFIERYPIKWTPTIIINGRLLPPTYPNDDLAYILFE